MTDKTKLFTLAECEEQEKLFLEAWASAYDTESFSRAIATIRRLAEILNVVAEYVPEKEAPKFHALLREMKESQ